MRLVTVLLLTLLAVGMGGVRLDPGRPTSLIETVTGQDAGRTSPVDRLLPPLQRGQDGRLHPLGCDELGRDLALRMSVALGTSLALALCGAVLAMAIGCLVGIAAGLLGGAWDAWLMRLTEATGGIPAVLVVLVLAAAFSGLGLWPILAAMGLLYWQPVARVVRARTLRLRGEPYVEASRSFGASTWHLAWVHIIPGVRATAFTYGALLVPRLVMLESLLSFLGVSASWMPVLVPCALLAGFLMLLNAWLDRLAER